jgi:hypothetical protein
MFDKTKFENLIRSAVTRRYLTCYPIARDSAHETDGLIEECLVFLRVPHSMIYYSPQLQTQLATLKNQGDLRSQDLAVRFAMCGDARIDIPLTGAIALRYSQTRLAVKARLTKLVSPLRVANGQRVSRFTFLKMVLATCMQRTRKSSWPLQSNTLTVPQGVVDV